VVIRRTAAIGKWARLGRVGEDTWGRVAAFGAIAIRFAKRLRPAAASRHATTAIETPLIITLSAQNWELPSLARFRCDAPMRKLDVATSRAGKADSNIERVFAPRPREARRLSPSLVDVRLDPEQRDAVKLPRQTALLILGEAGH